jgi:anti-sigma regulatory factor (Ser/Thr protein kinase)
MVLTAPIEPPDRTFQLPARPESITAARHRIRQLVEGFGISPIEVQTITLALSEVVTNSVVHAYPGDEPGPVEIRVWVEDDEVVLAVSDVGRGRSLFRGNAEGMGLRIVRSLASDVELHRVPGGGTEVVMTFSRRGSGSIGYTA